MKIKNTTNRRKQLRESDRDRERDREREEIFMKRSCNFYPKQFLVLLIVQIGGEIV